MYSRLKGMQIIMIIFVTLSIIYYEQAIGDSLVLRPRIESIRLIKDKLVKESSERLIRSELTQINNQFNEVTGAIDMFNSSLQIIMYLCYFNMMFFITDLIKQCEIIVANTCIKYCDQRLKNSFVLAKFKNEVQISNDGKHHQKDCIKYHEVGEISHHLANNLDKWTNFRAVKDEFHKFYNQASDHN